MVRSWILVLLLAGAIVMLPSCGREQQLVSIDIQPGVETFGSTNIPVLLDAGLTVQLRALGNYIHPPVTKDITNQATWASNTPGLATVSSTGLVTATGLDCGNALVSATVKTNTSAGNISSTGAIVTGTMTVNVVCFTATGGGPTLTVDFAGPGSGTVTSVPAGINCTTTCTASFASGTPIALTATPGTGFTFGGWVTCPSMSGTTCNLTLNTGTTVTALFN